ncbi:MAG TPA: polysaccharide deacetylase family protein [Salinivirgaceae bacterium]|nr:polysaccharide deacetylase family protein [Salinivirgaceae bacterium]
MLPYKLFSKIYTGSYWRIDQTLTSIYLTFDDGVNPATTPFILETLREFEVKATFFCIAKNVDRYPELFRQIMMDGHAVGNHTYSHLNGFKTDLKEYVDDAMLASHFIPGDLFRPPYGRLTLQQFRALKNQFRIVFWSRLSWDFDPRITPEKCLDKVKNTRPGDIVVFHDSQKAFPRLQYTLPHYLELMKKKGFKFDTL